MQQTSNKERAPQTSGFDQSGTSSSLAPLFASAQITSASIQFSTGVPGGVHTETKLPSSIHNLPPTSATTSQCQYPSTTKEQPSLSLLPFLRSLTAQQRQATLLGMPTQSSQAAQPTPPSAPSATSTSVSDFLSHLAMLYEASKHLTLAAPVRPEPTPSHHF